MDLLDRAKQYIKTGTISDIDWINEVLVELISLYCDYDLLTAQQEVGFDKLKAETYIELKTKKNLWTIKDTDNWITTRARLTALYECWDYKINKAKKNWFNKRINLLESKKIEIMTFDKIARVW